VSSAWPFTRRLYLGKDALCGREFRPPLHRELVSLAPLALGHHSSRPHTVLGSLSAARSSSDLKRESLSAPPRLALQASSSSAADMAPRTGRVAVAQMTATSDIDANFDAVQRPSKGKAPQGDLSRLANLSQWRPLRMLSPLCLSIVHLPSEPLLSAFLSSLQQAEAEASSS